MAVDIDADVGKWILEFLTRQPIDDHLLNILINILPPPNDNPGLKKSLLLRKVESEIAKQSISEAQLDLLQQIQELDFKSGITEHSGSIKVAYLAAAVECTVIFLRNREGNSRFEYFDAVKRIWKGRVCKLEKTAAGGLISEELSSWMNDIEAAVWDDDACGFVLKRSEGIDAIEAIRLYVKEERGKMGPSFLESVAEAFRVDEELRARFGNPDQVKDKGMDFQGNGQHAGPSHERREMVKANVLARRKQIAWQRSIVALSETNRGTKIADLNTSDGVESCKTYDLPTTPEVNRVQEALESSSLELHAVVEDPLPDALRIAENVGHTSEQANVESMPNHSHIPQNNVSKSSLMARNGTASTFEWNDSIDDVPGVSPIGGSRVQLPSPKRRVAVSPLKPYESCKVTKRRKPKRWTALEEDTLRAGVEKFGRGNWVTILKAYKDIFEERTSHDLKDKWRNLDGDR